MKKRNTKENTNELEMLSEEPPYLDTEEQEKIVQSFESLNSRQDHLWRVCFVSLSIFISSLFAYSTFIQTISPQTFRRHSEFKHLLSYHSMILAEFSACLIFCFSGLALFASPQFRQKTFFALFLSSLFLFLFWMKPIILIKGNYKWKVFWLPICSPLYILLCIYVDHTLNSMGASVQKLRSVMYDHKKV